MSGLNIIRAWKDEEYFSSLSESERVLLPQNPVGFVELLDDELRSATGGAEGAVVGSCHTCLTGFAATCDLTLTVSPA